MTTAAAKPVQTETVVLLAVAQLHKSPTQPRRRGETEKPTDDFIASIKSKGVVSPIIVRVRKAGGWEIVYGHRRWLGSKAAGLTEIPAIVRELTDEEVFEMQLVENVHRADMHPLDEADGFKRMISNGHTPAEIAGKIGRAVTYVVQRLKLCELGREVREALDKDRILLGVAVLVARVPLSLQAEAVESLEAHHGDGLVSVADAKQQLEAEYLLRLDQAPFDVADATLVAKAGSCMACPKRTGQQAELFPDVKRADLCTDRVCYGTKMDALWVIRKKEAKEGGRQILEGKAAEDAIRYGGYGYEKIDSERWVDGKGGGNFKKVRELLGKELPPIILARDEKSGQIVELLKKSDVDKLLKKNAPIARGTRTGSGGDDYMKKLEAKRRLQLAAVTEAITLALGRVSTLKQPDLTFLLVFVLIQRSWNDTQMQTLRRRQLNPSNVGAEQKLLTYLRSLTKPVEVDGLGVELALRALAPGVNSSMNPLWTKTLKAMGIDYAGIEKKISAANKAKKKAKATAKKKPAKKAA